MTDTENRVKQAALALDPDARAVANGWLARCPCPEHDDRHPSLQLAANPAGHVTAVCLAGCDAATVRKAARDRHVQLAG